MTSQLPPRLNRLPLFPLEGAVLLPGGELPLNIFEPRYLAMTTAAMAGDRLIGMIQPCPQNSPLAGCVRPFYTVGCAGKISSFEETKDGRFLITLHGVARFTLIQQKICAAGYREAKISFENFIDDFLDPAPLPDILARPHLVSKMRDYLAREGLVLDWEIAETIPDHRFYTLLSMICPFTPSEKQALLEAPTLEERCHMMKCLMDIACAETPGALSCDRPC